MELRLLTARKTWIDRMTAAGTNYEVCWEGFREACGELEWVASVSRQFSAEEKKAAKALELVVRLEGGMTDIMKEEFHRQYKVLGAPGDFGYHTKEGHAMQAVYEWWNLLCQATK